MKKTLFVLFCLIALAHSITYKDEKEEETMLAYDDPMPLSNGGLGCMTDSECEGVE